ncbi:MAG: terminase gpA endonuclease subunit [Novosphingobium sp.]
MLDFGQDEQLAFAAPVDLVARIYAELRFPEVVSVSESARRHRMLQNPGAYSGPWGDGPHFTGHLDRPMDCLGKGSGHREVGVLGPSQVGKSEIGNNWQLHSVCYDPADLLFIGPDRVLIESYVKKEFDKMVELARAHGNVPAMGDKLLPGAGADTLSLKRFRGADFFFYWPTGGRLRALPFSRIRVDDMDEIATDISDQGDIVSLARGRMGSFAAFGQTMLYVNSSPKLGARSGIEAFVAAGTAERLWVDCLMCGAPFALYGDRLDFDRLGTPRDAATSASVVCPGCGGAHLQRDKRRLLQTFRWVGKGEEAVSRREEAAGKIGELEPNARAGFYFDGLFGFRPWSEIAELGREAELSLEFEQDDSKLKAWDQTIIGRNYRERSSGEAPVSEDELEKRAKASPYVLREVPPGVEVLIASIDQQGNRFEVAVWGFGADFRAWLIDRFAVVSVIGADGRPRPIAPARQPEDWAALHPQVMSLTYPLAGAPHLHMKIFNTIVDTGGGGTTDDAATDNAFAWRHSMVTGDVASGRKALPPTAITLVKGGNKPNAKTLPQPTVDVKRQIKGAPQAELYVPNVNRLKGVLDRRLNRKSDGPGYISFPRDIDPKYLAELRAETKVGDLWMREPHRNNETWDLYVYAYTVVLRFGERDASLAWVPEWARPPRGGPASLEKRPIEPARNEAGDVINDEYPEASSVVRIGKPVAPRRGGQKPRRGIRSVRAG